LAASEGSGRRRRGGEDDGPICPGDGVKLLRRRPLRASPGDLRDGEQGLRRDLRGGGGVDGGKRRRRPARGGTAVAASDMAGEGRKGGGGG
jgi:hypothetical protein